LQFGDLFDAAWSNHRAPTGKRQKLADLLVQTHPCNLLADEGVLFTLFFLAIL